MRNKQQYSAVVLCALGVIAIGLTGCSKQQAAGKTKTELAAFAGDPSKMPASYRARIAGQQAMAQQQAAAMQKAAEAQKAAAEAQKAAPEAQKAAANQNATTSTH